MQPAGGIPVSVKLHHWLVGIDIGLFNNPAFPVVAVEAADFFSQ